MNPPPSPCSLLLALRRRSSLQTPARREPARGRGLLSNPRTFRPRSAKEIASGRPTRPQPMMETSWCTVVAAYGRCRPSEQERSRCVGNHTWVVMMGLLLAIGLAAWASVAILVAGLCWTAGSAERDSVRARGTKASSGPASRSATCRVPGPSCSAPAPRRRPAARGAACTPACRGARRASDGAQRRGVAGPRSTPSSVTCRGARACTARCAA